MINIADKAVFSSKAISSELSIDHNTVVSCLSSFQADGFCNFETAIVQGYALGIEGEDCLKFGSSAFRVFAKVRDAHSAGSPISREKLMEDLGEVGNFGFARAMKLKWLKLDKGVLVPTAEVSKDEDQELIKEVVEAKDSNNNSSNSMIELFKSRQNLIDDMVKRKLLCNNKEAIRTNISAGSNFVIFFNSALSTCQTYLTNVANQKDVAVPMFADFKLKSTISADMIQKGDWKVTSFKSLNFNAAGCLPKGGNLHPLLKVRAQFRRILMQMGFEEMPTDQWVESSFWNFDSLFQPQQHPARDAHDTFFVEPKRANKALIPSDYFNIVKKTHEDGGFGSLGWRYNWSEDEALSTVLRTHTTAVSSRMLYKLAKDCEEKGEFTPKKYFSVDRVFRNEKLDATHLAEFQQVEGLVADRNLTLADLMGTIREFFSRIGITQLWFKPAYNPYTEPSMEIFGYHPILKKRVEIGNSGIFRPEMLRPMGLPADVRVIAWGLSLERPTMINYGIDNIRDLSGHRVDLVKLRSNPICWMD